MITIEDYFGKFMDHDDVTPAISSNAMDLLEKVNGLLDDAFEHGVDFEMNPNTHSLVSGKQYGGFRPHDCPEGAEHSSHKEGMAVDIYDPFNRLDNWLTDKVLESHDLYRESPLATKSWCHLTTRSPKSGKRTFMP